MTFHHRAAWFWLMGYLVTVTWNWPTWAFTFMRWRWLPSEQGGRWCWRARFGWLKVQAQHRTCLEGSS